jgi:rare lipoprotein A
VVNRENGRSVVVPVNDRGPWKRGYLIDLSRESARVLGISGRASVALDAADETVNFSACR